MLTLTSPAPAGDPLDSTLPLATTRPPEEPDVSLAGKPQLLVPYALASPFQRAQGLRGARVILDAAYPFLSIGQWQQVLDYLQLPLHVCGSQVAFLPDGLGNLVHYLEAQYRPKPAGNPAPTGTAASGRPEVTLPTEESTTKQTYAIRNSLTEMLDRLSYWRRQPRAGFVNSALAQFLTQYPEASTPIPESREE